jgi:hypothetical protein
MCTGPVCCRRSQWWYDYYKSVSKLGIELEHPLSYEPRPRRTRMRTPFVKRHTTPMSGVFAFFPLSRAWRSQQTVLCSDLISV